MNLNRIFSGNITINGWGIAGLVVMVLGAVIALGAGRICPKHVVLLKSAGCLMCAVGAAIVIGFGK